jgi:hypothetical protein
MALKLIAPAGYGGIVQGRSGLNYTIAADGSISNVNWADADALISQGFLFAVSRHANALTQGAPAIANATVLMAAQTLVAGATLSISAQPDVPRQAQFLFITGGTVTMSAGQITVNYAANDGTTQSDVLNAGASLVSGTVTLSTSKGVEHLNSIVVGPTITGGLNPTVQGGTNNYIAVPLDPGSVDFVLTKETKFTGAAPSVGTDEAVSTLTTSTGLISPTTAPNGTLAYGFGYNYTFAG